MLMPGLNEQSTSMDSVSRLTILRRLCSEKLLWWGCVMVQLIVSLWDVMVAGQMLEAASDRDTSERNWENTLWGIIHCQHCLLLLRIAAAFPAGPVDREHILPPHFRGSPTGSDCIGGMLHYCCLRDGTPHRTRKVNQR